MRVERRKGEGEGEKEKIGKRYKGSEENMIRTMLLQSQICSAAF